MLDVLPVNHIFSRTLKMSAHKCSEHLGAAYIRGAHGGYEGTPNTL